MADSIMHNGPVANNSITTEGSIDLHSESPHTGYESTATVYPAAISLVSRNDDVGSATDFNQYGTLLDLHNSQVTISAAHTSGPYTSARSTSVLKAEEKVDESSEASYSLNLEGAYLQSGHPTHYNVNLKVDHTGVSMQDSEGEPINPVSENHLTPKHYVDQNTSKCFVSNAAPNEGNVGDTWFNPLTGQFHVFTGA